MAKKKPQSHDNKWMQLKSILWKKYKEKGIEWNSEKFNKIVTGTYEQIGGKNPKRVPKLAELAKKVEAKQKRQAKKQQPKPTKKVSPPKVKIAVVEKPVAKKESKKKPATAKRPAAGKKSVGRNSKWMQLKSILWKEYKEQGLYDWNSEKFNKLVTGTYEAIGKKDPSKVARIGLVAQSVEENIFNELLERSGEIPYYELGPTLNAFRDDPAYSGYVVMTDFNTPAFKDEKFHAEDFVYEGSQFQELVKTVDAERAAHPSSSPPAKILVEVFPDKKEIVLSIGAKGAPAEIEAELEEEIEEEGIPETKEKPIKATKEKPEPKKKKKTKPKLFKEIAKTPDKVKKIRNTIPENESKIKELERKLNIEKEILLPIVKGAMLKGDKSFKDYIFESTLNIKEWNREIRTLKNENEELRKQLAKQSQGFVAKPKKGNRGKRRK